MFGHERMDENHITRRVLMVEGGGLQVWGSLKLGWLDGVKVALSSRG